LKQWRNNAWKYSERLLMPENPVNLEYSAKQSYQSYEAGAGYEQERFSGFFGRYRHSREQRAVSKIVDLLPAGITIADCPCGIGRWWDVLARRANRIVAMDISEGMRRHAAERAETFDLDIDVMAGDAENIALPDNSVDFVFSHALTKHLPVPIQYNVLAEFARISRAGVICSFGVFSHLTYAIWRRRKLEESYPVFLEELQWMAKAAGLEIRQLEKCTTPIGVEHSVLFEKKSV